MSPASRASVGNEGARAVHGHSSGARAVVLGGGSGLGITEALAALGISEPGRLAAGSLATQLTALADVLDDAQDVPVVVAAADLEISHAALLDLLDRPGVRTAALVAAPGSVTEGLDHLPVARVGRDGRLVESVSTPAHRVSEPTHVLPGILRIDGPDRALGARLLRAAAPVATDGWGTDALAVTTMVLVRGGVTVQASALGPFDWASSGAVAHGAAGDPWRQRLRGASRGGDGFFSTYAVRPLSRRLTAVGLAHGWSPNVVTVVSLAFGLVAAALVATGAWWAWVLAAVLLLVALVVDCVDGEIARFTRRFSPLGAFLDAVGDRVKEYAVVAAVAAVAVRDGAPGWPWAVAVMAVVTVRHLEDYAYEHRLSHGRRSRPALLPVTEPGDGGSASARTALPPPPTTRAQVVHWTKKVVHMPIAERYLLLSLTLLTHRPMLVLWAMFVAVAIAVLWTQGGRVVAVLLRRDPSWAAVVAPAGRAHLDEQLDLGPLARAASRWPRLPFGVGLLGAVVLVVAAPVLLWRDQAGLAVVAAVVGGLVVGSAWRAPLHHPLAWQAPAALWLAEVVVVVVLVHHTLSLSSAAGFAFLAAIAYHRYDVVYRLRDTGVAPGRWLTIAGLGTEGRIVVLLLLAALAPAAVVPVLWVSAVLLAILYLTESTVGWRTWISAQDLRTGAIA